MKFSLWRKTTFDGRWPLIEDNLLWKTIFVGRGLLMEDDMLWKTSFGGKQPFLEDLFWWNTTFNGIQPSKKDIPKWRTIFDGRQPSMQDNLWRTKMLSLRLLKLQFDTEDQVLFVIVFGFFYLAWLKGWCKNLFLNVTFRRLNSHFLWNYTHEK